MVAVILQEFAGMFGKFTARAIVWGGPLVADQNREILSILLTKFDSICNKNVVFAQFRNLWDISIWKMLFEQHGYTFDEHLNVLFDLKQGKNELWKGMNPTRRKQINRGLKRDLHSVVVDSISAKELATCFAILKQVYNDAKLPHPEIGYFSDCYANIGVQRGYFKAALALYHDEIVGFRFFFVIMDCCMTGTPGAKKNITINIRMIFFPGR